MNIEDLIADANPVPHGSVLTPDSQQARKTLAQVLDAQGPGHAAKGLAARDRRGHGLRGHGLRGHGLRGHGLRASSIAPRIALGCLAAAGAAAIVLAQVLPGPQARRSDPAHRARTVSAELDALATAAAGQPLVRPLRPGQFQYTDSVSLTRMTPTIHARSISA
jgi:hypothetical protein